MIARLISHCIFVIALSGCATLPTAQLAEYNDSFAEVKEAGNGLLDELAEVWVEEVKRDNACVTNENGYKPCIDVKVILSPTSWDLTEPDEIIVRRAALDVVAAYNQLLLDVVEGRNQGLLAARLDEFDGILGSLTPIIPGLGPKLIPVVAVLGTLADKADDIREERIAVASVATAEKDIDELLSLMLEDSEAMYASYVSNSLAKLEADAKPLFLELAPARKSGDFKKQFEIKPKVDALEQATLAKIRAYERATRSYVLILDRSRRAWTALAASTRLDLSDRTALIANVVGRFTEMRAFAGQVGYELRTLRSIR